MAGRSSRLPAFLLLTALAAVAFHWARLALFPPPAPDERRLLPAVFPGAAAFSPKEGNPPRWTAYTPGPGGARTPIGAVVSSADLAPDVRGYAGPVPVLVGVAADGKITGVAIVEHHETPAYAARVEQGGFLRQFAGLHAGAPLRLDEDIDGVTRATVTAKAVADAVRRSARAAAREIHGLPVPAAEPGRGPLPVVSLSAVASLLLLGAVSLLVPNPALRWASLLGGLAVLGFWRHTYLSAVNFANALLWRWPAFREHLPWYLLFGAAVLAALLWRNLWCARLCPFGALQELVHALVGGRLPATPEEDREARRLRIAFLWLATLAVFLFGRAEAAHYEPFSTAFDFTGGTLRRVLLAAVLGAAALRHRVWCRYFCPTGTCLQLLGRMKTLHPFDERRGAAPATRPETVGPP